MKKDYTHISMILDRSGSMHNRASDAIGGFNKLLKDQKGINGKASLTLVQFDNEYEVVYSFADLSEVLELTSETFKPRGTTALRDAIGRTIEETGWKLNHLAEEERPENVVVVIITDGLENASKFFSNSRINEMIEHQQKNYNWKFTFIGSNQDAITSANELGIAASAALTNAPTSKGIDSSYMSLSASIGNLRRGLTKTLSYSPDDRKKAIQ